MITLDVAISLAKQTTFLQHLLDDEMIEQYSYGFFSEKQWELHLQVVAQRFFKRKSLGPEREVRSSHHNKRNKPSKDGSINKYLDANIDFVLDDKIAVEVKIETKSSKSDDIVARLLTDIEKLRNLNDPEDIVKYQERR